VLFWILLDLPESDVEALAGALLMDAYYQTGSPSVTGGLTPRLQSVQHENGARWHVQVGSAGVGDAEDPTQLQPLVAACEELAGTLPSREELKALREAKWVARQLIEEFRTTLTPDARLRIRLLEGRCDLCPPDARR